MLLHVLDFVMQHQRGDAEGEAENGDATERNRQFTTRSRRIASNTNRQRTPFTR